MARSVIRKDATTSVSATKAADGVHELTDMKVHEVSIVDAAANKRRFLVTKKGETTVDRAAVAEKMKALAAAGERLPGAELDAADVAAKVAPAIVAAPAVAAKAADVVPIPPPATAVSAVIVDPIAALDALNKSIEVEATPQLDGSVTITVADTTPAPVSAAPAEVQDKIKVAVIGGIDAIIARLQTLSAAVASSKGTWSDSGVPQELYGLWYIRDMISALYDIGGPSWEIEFAAEAAIDGMDSEMAKAKSSAHKAITAARVGKLMATHRALKYCASDLGTLLKELNGVVPAAVAAVVEAPTAKSTGTVEPAPAVAIDIFSDPRFIALTKAQEESAAIIARLQSMVAEQAETITKARNSVASSNGDDNNIRPPATKSDKVVWARDLAAPKTF